MKVTVFIPDRLCAAADALAQHLRKSRSALYAEALVAFLSMRDADSVRERLDAIYATQDSDVDSDLTAAQFHSLGDKGW